MLKYILGKGQQLKEKYAEIEKYSGLRFAYLAMIQQKQLEENQLLIRMPHFPNSVEAAMEGELSKCDKLMALYRIARAIQYL